MEISRTTGQLFYGPVSFPEGEELQEFQYKFLLALLAFGALATALFIVVGSGDTAAIPPAHLRSMRIFTAVATLLWFVLRGRKHFFLPVAWLYEIATVCELASAMIHVPADELRILWLYTNIPGVYLLLGRVFGGIITALTIIALVLGNDYMAAPYSPNAIATAVISMSYVGVFFHAYSRQLIYLFLRLREVATRDALTGVLNAKAYYLSCDSMIRMAQRRGLPYAVLFVDLDHFKAVNDTHGHTAGDIVLKAVAGCLAGSLRASDLLGRIGGEEFSIFLPDTDIEGARHLAESIRASIEALMPSIGEQRLKITASIGVARSAAGQPSMRAIQARADEAMYLAKAAGRNRVSALEETA